MINLILIAAGLLLVATGVYRAAPVEVNLKFVMGWAPIWVALGVLAWWTYGKIGPAARRQGAAMAATNAGRFLPLLVGLMFIMGFGQMAFSHYSRQILSSMSGPRGCWWSLVAAFGAPSPAAIAPVIKEMWANAALRPRLLLTLLTAPMLSWNLFIVRSMGLDWGIAGVNYAVGAVVALIAATLMSLF